MAMIPTRPLTDGNAMQNTQAKGCGGFVPLIFYEKIAFIEHRGLY
jgi:hypothetical protein